MFIGDFNIDEKEVTKQSLEKLNSFWEIFGLPSLVKGYTCYSKTHKWSIDLILTFKTFSIKKNYRSRYKWCTSSNFYIYENANYSSEIEEVSLQGLCFDEKTFLWELDSKNITGNSIYSNENYEYLFYQFAGVINKHAPLKAKVLRGNNAPFINKHLRKEIYWRSALRNKFNRKPHKLN